MAKFPVSQAYFLKGILFYLTFQKEGIGSYWINLIRGLPRKEGFPNLILGNLAKEGNSLKRFSQKGRLLKLFLNSGFLKEDKGFLLFKKGQKGKEFYSNFHPYFNQIDFYWEKNLLKRWSPIKVYHSEKFFIT